MVQALQQTQLRTRNPQAPEPTQPAPRKLRMAYLLSQYPAISHTFLLNEVLGLRARGLEIETISINLPDRPVKELRGHEETQFALTHYIQNGKVVSRGFEALWTALRHPRAVARGLRVIANLRAISLQRRFFWLFYLAEALLVGRWMQEHKLKHLHVHFGGPVASVAFLVSAAWKIPYSITVHGPEELLNTDAYHLREKVTSASFVFCISDFCRSQLCQLTSPASWSKFIVVRLGVDPVLRAPHFPARTKRVDRAELVCTGRLVPAKGHHILLQALERLHQRNVQVHATLIGGGAERNGLERFVRLHGLEEVVTFASALPHAETLSLVRSADVFVLASFAEGVPVALMEAMAFGLPCISTQIAGIPELIRSGVEGLLVAPGNVEELAQAIESLVNDASLRTFLGSSARQKIIRDFNLPLNLERLAEYFEERLAPNCLSWEAR